jgi:hypothetical protein
MGLRWGAISSLERGGLKRAGKGMSAQSSLIVTLFIFDGTQFLQIYLRNLHN